MTKRLEIYVGWTCNQKCTYCMEFPNMEKDWNTLVTKQEILKYLIKYKIKGFNHITYLGGEPFIQPVFLDALRLGKKMGFTILVTTNATTLHIKKEAKKFLSYIDELILSVQAIDKHLQQKISRTNAFVKWDDVFDNINKYWDGVYLKANTVITKDNLNDLFDITKYVISKGIKNIAITYPDLSLEYYGIKHLKERVAPTYTESMNVVKKIKEYCEIKKISLKIVDFPFCIFPKDNFISFVNKTDEIDYGNRVKVLESGNELDRSEVLPRDRRLINKCNDCKYNNLCWGPAVNYNKLYGYSEIKPIKND
ncbi:MAG: radical SAM protein [Candidatus Gracilibacteria bacterium]